jgi:hypothetical protein
MVRALSDCPDLPLGPEGVRCRVVVATHSAGAAKSRVGVTRSGVVYELFLTNVPQSAFTAADVLALYLHRGAFENALADEDLEQDPDRWCSHAASGQEAWQIMSQWVWNLRLELGHLLAPDPVRTPEFAPALPPAHTEATDSPSPSQGYGPAAVALPWKAGRFSGQDFALQADGTLRCRAGQALVARRSAQRSRREPARGLCGQHPQLSPLSPAGTVSMAGQRHRQAAPGERALASPRRRFRAPARGADWSRRQHRRVCKQLLRSQRVEVQVEQGLSAGPDLAPAPLSRAQRAHDRLD